MKNEITLRVVKRKPLAFCGRMLEVGTIYGWDAKGEFYCKNYNIIDMNASGKFPILEIMRYNSHMDKFCRREEGNITTDAIVDFHAQNESLCIIPNTAIARGWNPCLKGKKIDMKINPYNDVRFHDRRMPAGAIFGHDGISAFYVKDFDNIKFNRNGYPIMRVYRAYDDNGFRVKNACRWAQPEFEASSMTQAVYKMYMANKKLCVIDYGDEAAEVASKIELRLGWEEPVHYGRFHRGAENGISPKHHTEIKYVMNSKRTLEDISREQGGNLNEKLPAKERKSVFEKGYLDEYWESH